MKKILAGGWKKIKRKKKLKLNWIESNFKFLLILLRPKGEENFKMKVKSI